MPPFRVGEVEDALLHTLEDVCVRGAIERRVAAEEDVEDDPTGPLVAAGAVVLPDDLRRDVVGGAHPALEAGEVRPLHQGWSRVWSGQTEVDNLDRRRGSFGGEVDKDVLGLEVPVHDAQ